MNNFSFSAIIEKFKLQKEWSYFEEFNKAKFAPYHNRIHTMQIVQSCYDAICYYCLEDKLAKRLLIAAIFHDFNHSAGLKSDAENIAIAVSAFEEYAFNNEYSTPATNAVIELIKATQYPYNENDPWNKYSPIQYRNIPVLMKAIICDADAMTIYYEINLQNQLLGLYEEFKQSGQELSIERILFNFYDFYIGYTFRTDWGGIKKLQMDWDKKAFEACRFIKYVVVTENNKRKI